MNWLTGFAHQTGLTWLERRAAAMHHRLRDAGADEIGRDAAAVCAFLRRVRAERPAFIGEMYSFLAGERQDQPEHLELLFGGEEHRLLRALARGGK